MAEVVLENVTKIYQGDVRVVDDVSLNVLDREFLVLVGPSGCGKTTTLRMIAGLEDITSGVIRIGERVVNDIPPKDRDIAMVFQNYALYPHMSVYMNMAFGLMLRRKHKAWGGPFGLLFGGEDYRKAREERRDIDRRVRSVAEMLGIQDFLQRRPATLSGGQRQRVAVGRAVVRDPRVFLFDEPLSNLDARLRIEMRAELKQLHGRVQTTTVCVTHDQEEAMTLGDRVAVMKDGVIHQLDGPLDVYDRPVDRFVAGFLGSPPMNFLEGRLTRSEGRLEFDGGADQLALCDAHQERMAPFNDQPIVLGVRPEAIKPMNGEGSGAALDVVLDAVEPLGDRMDLYASTRRGDRLVCRMDARGGLAAGEQAKLSVDMERVHFFAPGDAGRNLSLKKA